MMRTPAVAAISCLGAAIAGTLLITGCTSSNAPAVSGNQTSDPAFAHIHELVPDPSDGVLLVATHEGLYRVTPGDGSGPQVSGPIGGLDFDPMGFTIADNISYASGHPGPTTPITFGSPNLGLITSTDLGNTWATVSLKGETDFHALTVSTETEGAPRVFGYDASTGRVERSSDGGLSWRPGAVIDARDMLAVGNLLYATTADGLAVSDDDGATFALEPDAPRLYLIASNADKELAGVDTAGTLWMRGTGRAWVRGGTVEGIPQALTTDENRVYVADDRGIAFTDDGGASWTVMLGGL